MLALVCGGSAAVGIASRLPQPAASAEKTFPVVVAKVDIGRGAEVQKDQIELKESKDQPPEGALTTLEEAVGRVAFVPLNKGEQLFDAKLSPRGAGRGLAALIPRGMRTLTIQTPNVASAGSGLIVPGNKVDVLLIPQNTASPETAPSTTVLQNVEIWAVGPRTEAPADNKMDVKEVREFTLLVTPEQAGRLMQNQNKGMFHLALRNPDDKEVYVEPPPKPAIAKELEKVATIITTPPPPPALRIRTIHGNYENEVHLEAPKKGFLTP
jgi:pilus assembly protein CpaB